MTRSSRNSAFNLNVLNHSRRFGTLEHHSDAADAISKNLFSDFSECVSSLAWPLLAGDFFYNFRCSICTGGVEYLTRLPLSWVDVTDIVMYQLHLTRPDSEAFETNSEIFPYLDSIWSLLQVPVEVGPFPQSVLNVWRSFRKKRNSEKQR